jgi:hypothetical protein
MNVTFLHFRFHNHKEFQMKIKKILIISTCITIFLLLLNACGQSPTVQPTITFSGETCTYSGPKSLSAKFDLNVVVKSQTDTVYGFVIVTLQAGKTIEDLQVWPSVDPPEWLKNMLNDTGPVFASGTTKQNVDLAAYSYYSGDPIYFACFADKPTRKIGALGPIEISQ